MKRIQFLPKAAVLSSLLALPLVNNTLGAGAFPVDPKTTITATMDGGTAKTGNTWYEFGAYAASNTTGLATGLIHGQTDPFSTYLIPGGQGNNALMLDSTSTNGTLTFSRPLSLTALSFAGSTGNGSTAPTLTPTLHFSDGTSDTLTAEAFKVGDWFGNTPIVETSAGRVDVVANTVNNVGAANPRVLALDITVPTADQTKFITSIDLAFKAGAANNHTAIFGVSGDFTGLGHFDAIPLDATSFNQDMIVGIREVPEPGTLALFGLGAASMLLCYRRKKA